MLAPLTVVLVECELPDESVFLLVPSTTDVLVVVEGFWRVVEVWDVLEFFVEELEFVVEVEVETRLE